MSIAPIKSETAFKEFIAANQVAVVKFYADWCGPCRQMTPKVKVLSNTYTSANFAEVNIDELEEVAESENISSLPAFKIYAKGVTRKIVVGANVDKLRDAITEVLEIEGLSTTPATTETAASTTPTETPAVVADNADKPAGASSDPITSATSTQTIIQLSSASEFSTLIQKPAVFAYFFATWCGPCKLIGPKINQIVSKYPNIQFVKVDADEFEEIGEQYDVASLPSFKFFKNGKLVNTVVGTKIEKIEEALQALA